MAVAAILKNRKISISQPLFERFRRSLARLRSSTFSACPIVKNVKILQSYQMAAYCVIVVIDCDACRMRGAVYYDDAAGVSCSIRQALVCCI